MEEYGELIIWGFIGAINFVAVAARPIYVGMFFRHLGHQSPKELVRAANQSALTLWTRYGCCLGNWIFWGAWMAGAGCWPGSQDALMCYLLIILKAGK